MKSVAFVGNPNVGKTSIFNALTGLNYKVANYPGVTVERKTSEILVDSEKVLLTDLPGLYSLEGVTEDEKVASQYLLSTLKGEVPPDVIINVVDIFNLERGLYLTAELASLGLPLIIALTMSELAVKHGLKVLPEKLSRATGHLVVILPKDTASIKKILLPEIRLMVKGGVTIPPAQLERDVSQWVSYAASEGVVIHNREQLHRQQKIDGILTHPVAGYAVLVTTVFLLFQALFVAASYPMDWIESGVGVTAHFFSLLLPAGPIQSLLVDGIIGGVGSVLVFIPQIALLIFLLSLLEQSGYLSRAACLVDKPLTAFGLQGRSFIPLLSGFACAIPATLSTRSIPSWTDRVITIFVLPLISCSARLPVYLLLVTIAVPPESLLGIVSIRALVVSGLYFLGVGGALLLAKLLRGFTFREAPSFFALELPLLRVPSLSLACREAYDRMFLFLRDTGPVIFACTVILWFLASFPFGAPTDQTLAAYVGKAFQPLFQPLGYSWELTLAIISSLAAREVFVSSLATLYNLSADDGASSTLTELLSHKISTGEFSRAVAYSLMVFYVWSLMCVSTLSVARRETGSWKYPFFMFVTMGLMAYGGAWITYQIFQ